MLFREFSKEDSLNDVFAYFCQMIKDKITPLNVQESFVCEMIFGSVPVDTEFVRQSALFKQGNKDFIDGKWHDIYEWWKSFRIRHHIK